jgi:arylsulfatase A-like enzyme
VEFDWAVGQLLKTLDRLELSERTLIIVTSDNGGHQYDGLGGHRVNGPWRGIKTEIYEGGHRVPFIARWPGKIAPGTVCDETICLTDLLATCASIVDHDIPADAGEDSFNILPALTGEPHNRPVRNAVIHHSCAGMFAIREGRWKLIEGVGRGMNEDWEKTSASGAGRPERDPRTGRFKDLTYYFPPPPEAAPGEPPGQLYDLENDPGETDNLWERHPEVVEHLLALLNRYRDQGHSKSG